MMRIAHIINPVIVGESSDLFIAQPITFDSLKVAQEYASNHGVKVELYSSQFSEDHEIIPEYLIKTPDLTRSILDLGDFKIKRKLPFIKDILDRLNQASDADYFVYTNVDIAVVPHFYVVVAELIAQGYDSLVINRRTISQNYKTPQEIHLMYSEIGTNHPGYDCFIFSKNSYKNFSLFNTFIGAIPVGACLLINLYYTSKSFKVFKDLHLTFHLGDDGFWKTGKLNDYELFNIRETNATLEQFIAQGKSIDNQFILKYYNELYHKVSQANLNNSIAINKLIYRKSLLYLYYKIIGLSNRLKTLSLRIKNKLDLETNEKVI
ncbi:hypothetical protein [Chroococcus sp. FPU101]|uniref:hypothetical protein n=1 Tax=Chroococcus sp. FPU101 TaxID=1974212 RepID=UPI001A8C57EB|nr:hypothetical protein [Chroococcus sp. FPU101]GFE67894.1 hypothetical protein CFPU101_05040 [Chroococcus sp. FPU101]